MKAIELKGIRKSYDKGKILAINDVSLFVEKAELFGLIGPDGAGKTTLFRILATLLLADKGTATVDGLDVVKDYKAIRNRVGYMPGKFSLYQDLSVEENLSFFATVFGTSIEENFDLIKDIYQQIEPFKHRKAGKLSGGMKQKLALCCALIHKPTVLFLDEPTTGVDAVSRKEFWEMLQRLKAQQITIMVSTPYMDEAMQCDRIALIQNGSILSVDSPAEIKNGFNERLWSAKSSNMLQLLQDLRASPAIKTCYTFGETHHITLKKDSDIKSLKEYLNTKVYEDLTLMEIEPTIEDCFMALMTKSETEEPKRS